ncbi:leucine-rich repeat flightless-interacting protein 2 isoform X8 [Girardinichthys multiradiatus]|uniref:leucine-rich repeat flightless-interacting protein 2 isoform X8 n=1 Tax=Girardinichthys multiradiatus TaxID=208333 RepID=UPI001FADD23A|nr:leucine-rich repeat flightless-interacting protein 2 isoform X8 [Girardinichthys multiradiatus]
MGTQGPGRKRIPNRDKQAAEDDALSQIAREAEARLAAKRAARAEAREIRMKELERQQKELFHSTKKYYGLDNKWGHIEQWMEDSERYSRLSRKHASISDDEERMSVGSRGSYRPSDYGGLLGSSSRASSRASSARASPVVEERTDREFVDKGSRTASTLSAATLASLGGASSRRGSCDTSFSVETEASIREMKDSLAEAEEKYRRAMVSNAQLHNDKTTLMFQVENLREELSDMEELLWEARRRWEDSSKELERERQTHSVLKVQFKEMEDSLRRTNELLKNHGVAVSPDSTPNGDAERAEDDSACCLAEDSPPSGRESTLELRMKKLFDDRESLHDQVRLLKSQLEQRNGVDGVQNPGENAQENEIDPQLLELQRDSNRQISELKFKLVKSEQEVTTLEQNVLRLEGQVCRYKSASENAEKIEDELKVEKRRLQRELRSALDRIEELEVSNSHLSKRLEKMKANRNALLAQQ